VIKNFANHLEVCCLNILHSAICQQLMLKRYHSYTYAYVILLTGKAARDILMATSWKRC